MANTPPSPCPKNCYGGHVEVMEINDELGLRWITFCGDCMCTSDEIIGRGNTKQESVADWDCQIKVPRLLEPLELPALCPDCGSSDFFVTRSTAGILWFAQCDYCQTMHGVGSTMEEAIDEWNAHIATRRENNDFWCK